ncbi:hypothetical protein [Devosia riboflavina]|uniref:hypothetical protein n=1 Tax=Devosia riboflavina TaxID=46914 RepID=UPI000ABBC910|nr:hypothetical protein [Devosia riboflavina]
MGDIISATVAKQLDASFVEKEVETRVSKLVVEAVDRALRGYSETAKLIEKAVEEALRVERLDLPSYGTVVAHMVKAQIEANVSELVAGRLAEDVTELLKLAPKEIKLSEIAEEMLKPHRDDGSYGSVITVIVEQNEYGSTWLSLDEETHHEGARAEYQCQHRILISKDGTISGGTIDNRDLKSTKHIGRTYGLGQKLRAYFACGTKIILDEDDVVTSVGDY